MKKFLAFLLSATMLVPAFAFAQTPTSTSGNYTGQYHRRSIISYNSSDATTTPSSLPLYTGVASNISGTTLTLTSSDGTVYSVDASNVQTTRKYGASTQISAIQNGDTLNVRGTLSGSDISAVYVRDTSLQAKNGTFSGTVTALNSPSFTLQSTSRGSQTVNTDSTTVFNENGKTDSNGISDIMVGSKVIVTGVWDSANSNITASKINLILRTQTVSGTFAGLSGNTITLDSSDSSSTVYTVDATSAKVTRKFGGTMQLTDIQTGDSLSVRGLVDGTNVTASAIRDMSQQQRNGTFSGTVSALSGASFTIQSRSRGSQTVNTDSTTIFNKNGQTDSNGISDISVGSTVTATGLWDNTQNTIAATKVNLIIRTQTTTGIFSSYSGDIITMTGVNSSSTTYTVDATTAKLIRRYGAPMQFTDYQAGDTLSVRGTVNGTNITASSVRDESLQAHNGTFVGSVTSINGSSFVIQSTSRGSQTVNTSSTTVFRMGSTPSSMSSLAVGQTVTVTGVWDRTNTNITATRVTIKVTSQTVTGTLQALSGSILTVVDASSTTWTVDATNAKVRFEHGHSGSLENFQVNDQVKAWFSAPAGQTSVTATIVQDLSRTYDSTSTPTSTPAQ
jgi:hypothetical protein